MASVRWPRTTLLLTLAVPELHILCNDGVFASGSELSGWAAGAPRPMNRTWRSWLENDLYMIPGSPLTPASIKGILHYMKARHNAFQYAVGVECEGSTRIPGRQSSVHCADIALEGGREVIARWLRLAASIARLEVDEAGGAESGDDRVREYVKALLKLEDGRVFWKENKWKSGNIFVYPAAPGHACSPTCNDTCNELQYEFPERPFDYETAIDHVEYILQHGNLREVAHLFTRLAASGEKCDVERVDCATGKPFVKTQSRRKRGSGREKRCYAYAPHLTRMKRCTRGTVRDLVAQVYAVYFGDNVTRKDRWMRDLNGIFAFSKLEELKKLSEGGRMSKKGALSFYGGFVAVARSTSMRHKTGNELDKVTSLTADTLQQNFMTPLSDRERHFLEVYPHRVTFDPFENSCIGHDSERDGWLGWGVGGRIFDVNRSNLKGTDLRRQLGFNRLTWRNYLELNGFTHETTWRQMTRSMLWCKQSGPSGTMNELFQTGSWVTANKRGESSRFIADALRLLSIGTLTIYGHHSMIEVLTGVDRFQDDEMFDWKDPYDELATVAQRDIDFVRVEFRDDIGEGSLPVFDVEPIAAPHRRPVDLLYDFASRLAQFDRLTRSLESSFWNSVDTRKPTTYQEWSWDGKREHEPLSSIKVLVAELCEAKLFQEYATWELILCGAEPELLEQDLYRDARVKYCATNV